MWLLLVSKVVTVVLSSMPHRPRCGAVGDYRLRPWRFGVGRCDEDNCRERPGRHASRLSRSDWELLFAVTFLSTGTMVERSLPVLYRCSQFLRREASHRTSSASSLLNHKRPRDLTTPSNTELFLGFCCQVAADGCFRSEEDRYYPARHRYRRRRGRTHPDFRNQTCPEYQTTITSSEPGWDSHYGRSIACLGGG